MVWPSNKRYYFPCIITYNYDILFLYYRAILGFYGYALFFDLN